MLAKKLIWMGQRVTWVNSSELQITAQTLFDKAKGNASREKISAWVSAKNLVIDDIGNLKATEAVVSALYSILEPRSNSHKLTIWTSNEQEDQMLLGDSISDIARSRVISRISGNSQIILY
jgi:DNA replication protein DnaC